MPRIRRTDNPSAPSSTPSTTPGPTAPNEPQNRGWVRTGGSARPSTDGFSSPSNRSTPTAANPVPLRPGASLFLSSAGHIVGDSSQSAPASVQEQGELLFQAAQLSETTGENLFAQPSLTVERKAAALISLRQAFNAANPELSRTNGFANKTQALQTRAAAAPLLLDLAKSLDSSQPTQRALQEQALNAYLQLLESEPHGLARNFMIYDLDRAKGALPHSARPQIDTLMREVAPLTPPYEEWFKNGNTKLKVDYYVGNGFWEEEIDAYVSRGFTKKENHDGTVTLKKPYTYERDLNDGSTQRIQTEVELTMHDGPQELFEKMNDPKTHMVVYSGHANYGREVPSHLRGAPEQAGAKAFFLLQCGGKGVHDAVLERYPDLQVVSSKNSSYASQDHETFLNALEGISKRQPWSQISTQNTRRNSDNYYFPSDTLLAKRALDRDKDGKVDSWDRVVNYDTFHPQAHVSAQLTPQDPGKAADVLDGRAVHGAILRFQRLAGYNQWAQPMQNQGVLNAGYYEGAPTDPLVKLTPVRGEDGGEVYKLQVNKHYAHATEETLGAALHYELGRYFAQREGLSPGDAKAAGLLMAAKAIDVDTGQLDRETWKALLDHAQLPPSIKLADAQNANHADEHFSAGGAHTLSLFKESLQSVGVAIR